MQSINVMMFVFAGLNVDPLADERHYTLVPRAMFFEFIPIEHSDEAQPETLFLDQVGSLEYVCQVKPVNRFMSQVKIEKCCLDLHLFIKMNHY